MHALLTLLAAVVIFSARAGTAPELPLSTHTLDPGEFKGGLGGSYLSTTYNFDRSGSKQHLPGSGSFESFHGDMFLQYGASSQLTLLADIPLSYTHSVGIVTTGTGAGTLTTNNASGPGDLTAGARFETSRAPVRSSFDALVQFPLYSRLLTDQWASNTAGAAVPLGTGVTEFTLMGRVDFPLGEDVSLDVGAGFIARTGGFSNLLPYECLFKYEENHGLFLRVGIKGYFTISTDEFSSASLTSPPNDRATAAEAGSQLYNAINPSSFAGAGALGAYIGRNFFFAAGAELPLIGRNIAAQPLFAASIGLDFGGARTDPHYQHSNRGFQQYYLSSKVVRVNNQLRQILIDKGEGDLIKKGELLDVFEPDAQDGTFGETLARGRVIEVGPTKAKIQLLEFFKDVPLQEGFVVRRPVR